MPESVAIRDRTNGTLIQRARYSREEIRRAWQDPRNRCRQPDSCVRYSLVHEDQALEVSALYLRLIHNDPLCVMWQEPEYLLFHLPRELSYTFESYGAALRAIFSFHAHFGVDRWGEPFSDSPGHLVDVPLLVSALREARGFLLGAEDRTERERVLAQVDRALADGYLGGVDARRETR